MQYVTFSLRDDLFGIPIFQVQEFTRSIRISPIIGHDARIAGMVNLRGKIATVLNLTNCLYHDEEAGDARLRVTLSDFSNQKMIILNTEDQLPLGAREAGIDAHEEPIVLLVDKILEVVSVEPEEFYAPPANVSNVFIEGVIRKDDQLLSIISLVELTEEISRVA